MKALQKKLDRQNDKFNTNFFEHKNISQESLPLFKKPIAGKKVEIDFNGGLVSSDAGILLLSEVERNSGIIQSISKCIHDERRQYYIDHSINDIISQRVHQIACGYEDAIDSNSLRIDPVMKMATGCSPMEGDDLASQPTITRLGNSVRRKDLLRIAYSLVDQFISSYSEEPSVVVLDFDDTDNIVHGSQQMRLFNSYYGEYCYMPLHIYEGLSGKIITSILRPGKRSSGKLTISYLKRLVKKIRQSWSNTIIVFRGDGHFSSPELFERIENQENFYSITGLTSNNILLKQVEMIVNRAKTVYENKKQPVKLYHSFLYRAQSWEQYRRIVVKVEVSNQGVSERIPSGNIRFISTDMFNAKTKALYEDIYCRRGKSELYIKDHKKYLKSDRSSCHRFEANQFRLFLHSIAYVLLHSLRTEILKGTEFSNATFETIRLKLIKIGARIIEIKTKIKIHLPTSYPYKSVFKKCMEIFAYLRNVQKPLVPI